MWKLTGWVVCVSDELKAPQGLELLSAGCRHPLLGNVLDSQGKYRLEEKPIVLFMREVAPLIITKALDPSWSSST